MDGRFMSTRPSISNSHFLSNISLRTLSGMNGGVDIISEGQKLGFLSSGTEYMNSNSKKRGGLPLHTAKIRHALHSLLFFHHVLTCVGLQTMSPGQSKPLSDTFMLLQPSCVL